MRTLKVTGRGNWPDSVLQLQPTKFFFNSKALAILYSSFTLARSPLFSAKTQDLGFTTAELDAFYTALHNINIRTTP
jgi:hypothetical protein